MFPKCIGYISYKNRGYGSSRIKRKISGGLQNFQRGAICIWRAQAAVILQAENLEKFYDLIGKNSTFGV